MCMSVRAGVCPSLVPQGVSGCVRARTCVFLRVEVRQHQLACHGVCRGAYWCAFSACVSVQVSTVLILWRPSFGPTFESPSAFQSVIILSGMEYPLWALQATLSHLKPPQATLSDLKPTLSHLGLASELGPKMPESDKNTYDMQLQGNYREQLLRRLGTCLNSQHISELPKKGMCNKDSTHAIGTVSLFQGPWCTESLLAPSVAKSKEIASGSLLEAKKGTQPFFS